MTTRIYLTDERADLAGYLRARVGHRSDIPSLIRAITATVAGPTAGVGITRKATDTTALAWITEPLTQDDLTGAAWELHAWAQESAAAANAALRLQVLQFVAAEGATVLDDNPGTELTLLSADYNRTTGTATPTALALGDRLVFKLLIDDATALSMAAGQTVTLSFNGERPRAEGDTYLVCPDSISELGDVPQATRDQVRSVLKSAVEALGGSGTNLTADEVDVAIGEAISTYSADKPLLMSAALSGDGATTEFSLPAGWIHGFSQIQEVEYPAGQQIRILLADSAWEILHSVLGSQPTRRLRFILPTPGTGTDNVILRFTTRHVHTTELDTIPAQDFDAFCWLAASYGALRLEVRMANAKDSTIAADSVNHRDGQQRWAAVAKDLRERYQQHVSVGVQEHGPALAFANWNIHDSQRRDYVFHPQRYR